MIDIKIVNLTETPDIMRDTKGKGDIELGVVSITE